MLKKFKYVIIPSILIFGLLLSGFMSDSIAQEKEPLWLVYQIGMRDGVKETDGVIFKIEIAESGKKGTIIAQDEWNKCEWKSCRIDISKYRDMEVTIRFIADPGPTTTYDWACWGEPAIMKGDKLLLDFAKTKIWKSGTILDGNEISPMDSTATGASFSAGKNICGKIEKMGYFAHPGYKGDAVGAFSFGEFKINLAKPTETTARVLKDGLPSAPSVQGSFPWGIAPCFKVSSPIKIDGNLDDWPAEIKKVFLSVREREQISIEVSSYKPGFKGGWAGPNDFSSAFFLAWDDNNLYIAEIRKDDIFQFMDTMSKDFFRSDYLRIYVSKSPVAGKPTENDYIFAIIPEGEQGKPAVSLCSYDGYEQKNFPYKDIEVAPQLYKGGWAMEVKIPFSSMKIIPKPGMNFGFQIIIGDSDTPMDRHYEMAWKPKESDDYWYNPSTLGKLVLVEESFAWLDIERKIYAISESPKAQLGLFSLKPGAEVKAEISLTDEKGNVLTSKSYPGITENKIIVLPELIKEGRQQVNYSLEFKGGSVKGSIPIEVMKERKRKDLLKLVQPATPTITPSLDANKYSNNVRKEGEKYIFEYDGEDCKISYEYLPSASFNIAILLNDVLLYKTNPSLTGPAIQKGSSAVQVSELQSQVKDINLKGAELSYVCSVEERITLNYNVSIKGKTLIIDVSSPQADFASFSGPTKGIRGEEIFITYLHPSIKVTYLNNCFLCSYWDWTMTGCSGLTAFASTNYGAKTDGTRNPLKERVYLTASPEIMEVIPNLPNPKSPFLEMLAGKLMLDWWGWGTGYEGSARYLEMLKSYGVDELAIIYHVWQKQGYDNGLPEHYPAMESMGGDEGMKILGSTAKKLGYVFSLHENYIDYYPNFPGYTEEAITLNSNGDKRLAWYMPSTKIQSFQLKPTWMEKYAREQSPEIHKRYQTTAAYLDVQTCGFTGQVDFDARQEGAGSFTFAFGKVKSLFNFMRKAHEGPLFGEGAYHPIWAGIADGCEAQSAGRGGEVKPVLVDFDLLKVHPLTVNHGMGYYSRWQRNKSGLLTNEELNKYRGQELAYGHAGFVNTPIMPNITQTLREYYLVQPIQAKYNISVPVEIKYLFDDKWVNANVVCRTNAPRKIYVKYENGLELWINDERGDWEVEGYTLPPFGFLAKGAGVEAHTAKRNSGFVGDYSETAKTIFVDPRTYEAFYSDKKGTMKIEPGVALFEDLGGRKFSIKYNWKIDQKLDKDYTAFVHFTNKAGQILWQNDHKPSVPTSAWKEGSIQENGPFTVEIPSSIEPGIYDIRIGLYISGGGRLALTGNEDEQTRCVIGQIELKVEKDKPKLTLLPAIKGTGSLRPGKNPAGTKVDFGKLVSDIALRMDKEKNGYLIMPVPHSQSGNISLNLDKLLSGKKARVAQIVALDKDKKEIEKIKFTTKGEEVEFTTSVADAWYYRVEL